MSFQIIIKNAADDSQHEFIMAANQTLKDLHQLPNCRVPFRLLHCGRVLNNNDDKISSIAKSGKALLIFLVPSIQEAKNAEAPKDQSFKVYFAENEIRRFRGDSTSMSFESLVCKLESLFKDLYHREMRIQYIDSDGDKITVQSEVEWLEAKAEFKALSTVRLYVIEGLNPKAYFKDGPKPQTLGFYEKKDADDDNSSDDSESSSSSSSSSSSQIEFLKPANSESRALGAVVPNVLARLLPGGRLIPQSIPEWLKSSGAVRLIYHNVGTADVDIDLDKLWSALQQRSLHYFETKEIEEAKKILIAMSEWKPQSCWVWYNTACAHSLLGDIDAGLLALQAAFDAGYSNIAHALCDEDLIALRAHSQFQLLINRQLDAQQQK